MKRNEQVYLTAMLVRALDNGDLPYFANREILRGARVIAVQSRLPAITTDDVLNTSEALQRTDRIPSEWMEAKF